MPARNRQPPGAIKAQAGAEAGAEIYLQKIFDAVNVGLLLVDQNGIVKRANNVISRWLGKGCSATDTDQPGDFLGCIHTLAAPAKCGHTAHCAACPIRSTFETVLRSGQPIHDVETEAQLLCGGKEIRLWLAVSADPLVIAGQRHTILALNNITELRLAQQREMKALAEVQYQDRLRSLANKLVTTEEQGRRQLARQIHDTIIQNLSLSTIKLGSVAQAVGKTALADELARLKTVRELIDEAITQCRQLMADLTPTMLYELGLEPALDDLIRKIQRQHGVEVRLTNNGTSKHLPGAMRGLLFQSTRELIINALKHAGPCQIEVITRCQGDQIHIRVADNGAGFDPAKPQQQTEGIQGGFGLFHIRERVEGLGGQLNIHSELGQGTVATITAPLNPSQEAR